MGQRVLIDGRSGSGKTELAKQFAKSLPGSQLVRLDDIYPGWSGLEAGSLHVHDYILASPTPRWQRWDWQDDAPAEWHVLDPARPIIIEGCGALSRANRELADHAIWMELDEPTRKQRALARDGGGGYESFWDMWAAQELVFIDREGPQSLADQVVEG